MIDERFGILAGILSIAGCAFYIKATLEGKVKPHRVSWLLWGLIPIIVFFAQLVQGVVWSAFISLNIGLGPLVIFAVSFLNKQADWKISQFDIYCGIFSLLAILIWAITSDPNHAVLLSIIADLAAATPTLIKSFYHPETEHVEAYLLGGIGTIVGLLSLQNWDFANASFLAYCFFLSFILVVLIKFKLGKIILSR